MISIGPRWRRSKKLNMRRSFISALTELAAHDPRIVLLTGDLGFTVLEPFRDRFPERFFNVGVAEQNMIGVAAGLAEAGRLPFVYSMSTFLTMRGYEFIRNGVVGHKFPVRLIGVGAGFDYSKEGMTHYALEDVGLLRMQPDLSLFMPADGEQAKTILQATWNDPGPVYYRLGKDEQRIVPGLQGAFEKDKPACIRKGSDLLILALGEMAYEAAELADFLSKDHSISCHILVVSHLAQPPSEGWTKSLSAFDSVVTLESHYASGALGSMIAERIADHGLRCRLLRAGVKNAWDGKCGDRSFMMDQYQISPKSLVDPCRQLVKRNPR